MAIGMARVEEGEVEVVKDNSNEDLYTRASWIDAGIALDHIKKGRATGNRGALLMRRKLQDQFVLLGSFVARNAGKIIFVALLIAATLCVGLKSARLVTDMEKLWVEEGGRLERELEYVSKTLGDGAGTTNQILVQTSKESAGTNVLSSFSLLTHLNILSSATSITVDMFDISWGLRDLCFATNFPLFENNMINQIFERLTPCAIITPLDCFWEGSKLLGPEYPVRIPGFGARKWTNINPQAILEKMKETHNSDILFPLTSFSKFLKRAGVSTAYQEKPCLNPMDPECPETAPNKNSKETLDIGAELTGGCYGFASKFLHWPQQLIVGGETVNRTNHIKKAEALQSVVQLMGEKDLFEFWQDHYKVHHIDWSKEKSKLILDAWVHKFSKTVEDETRNLEKESQIFSIYPFSSATLGDLLRKMSQLSPIRIAIGYTAMTIYVCFCLMNVSNKEKSSIGLALAGVLLVVASVASGLGLCALLGLPFNAATMQILPFLALGLGINNIFVLVHSVSELSNKDKNNKLCQVEEALKRSGVTVLLTSLCTGGSFFAAALIPVRALRLLCLQAGLLTLLILIAILIVFPAMMALDIRRRRARRLDVFCCIPLSVNSEGMIQPQNSSKKVAVTRVVSPAEAGTVTQVLCPKKNPQECWVGVGPVKDVESCNGHNSDQSNDLNDSKPIFYIANIFECSCWSLRKFIRRVYAPTLGQRKVKVFTILLFLASVVCSVYGALKIRDGLDLTDIVPRGTIESSFLEAQEKYFGFYNIFVITQGNFEYPTKQQMLYDYHQSFNRIPWILKNDNGGLPDTWISLFRDWLIELQNSFDREWKAGTITEDGWSREASDDSVLAYKLLLQTGHVDHPVDRSLLHQNRLVNKEGIINPNAFYNYLTAWFSNDPLTYSASQADIRPIPRYWYHERTDTDLKIPKSSPIIYAQFPFLLHDLKNTESVTEMIAYVREICLKFEEQGLPNFPSGVPFTFWEQYISLRFYFLLALAAIIGGIFVLLCVALMNVWASSLYVLILSILVLQLTGVLSLLGLKLSAVSAVLLVISVGIAVQYTLHILIAFLTALGNRNKRSQMAVANVSLTTIQGSISTLLAILMLLFSEFDFIRRHFFYVLGSIVLLGLIDGLLFLPVILSIIGPPAEVSSKFSDHLPIPTPPPSPILPSTTSRMSNRGHTQASRSRSSRSYPHHKGSNLSLTTITEEPASGDSSQLRSSSHEIVIEPQVVVESTSSQSHHGPCDSGESSVVCCDGGRITTTVTATAKVKVEVFNQINGNVDTSSKSTTDSQSSGKSCCGRHHRCSPSSSCSSNKSNLYSDRDCSS